ncbi:hypothetical protein D3C72_1196810 [compost metagenome]
MLQLGLEREQALVGLQARQQVGAQVDQKAHAAGLDRKALQQPHARRHQRAAQAQLGLPFVGRADGALVLVARALELARVGGEMLAHERPVVAALFRRGAGVGLRDGMGAAAALDLAHARIDHRLQLGQHAAQRARRQRLVGLAQRGLQPLGGGAGAGLGRVAGRAFRGAVARHGNLGRFAHAQARLEPLGRTHRSAPVPLAGWVAPVTASPWISAVASLRARLRAGASCGCAWRRRRLRCRAP